MSSIKTYEKSHFAISCPEFVKLLAAILALCYSVTCHISKS